MMADGDTSRCSSATASGSVRSAHRTSVDGIRSAALRLAGTSRSVATTCLPSTISCRTVSEPTRPNAPVTSTVSAVIDAAPSHRFALHRRRRAWRITLHGDAEYAVYSATAGATTATGAGLATAFIWSNNAV